MITKIAVQADHPVLIDLWEKSVKATHDFLTEQDFVALKKEMPEYFKQVELLMWYDNSQLVGFSGTKNDSLEMLFLDPELTGRGFGRQIITSLIENYAIKKVSVNEQNQSAARFYQRNGFQIENRLPLDPQGRPYPILELSLKKL